MDIVLIAGLWLDGRAWDAVVPELERRGHRAWPVTLPGQGDGSTAATLEDQVAAVVATVDEAARRGPGGVVVVGHSMAATLAWSAADRRPDSVGTVVLVGGWPASDGERYADLFEPVDGSMHFPGWEPFEGPDSADLDDAARRRIESTTVPVPVGVSRAVVRLRDERRYDVPTVLVCPEFTPDEARAWMAEGELRELAAARHLELVDIDSGHWPMFSRPVELAQLLSTAADRAVRP